MSGKWTLRESLMLAGAVVLAISIAYFVGRKQGHLDEKLAANHSQIIANDSASTRDSVKVDSARKKDAVLDSTHDVVRSRVRIVHDTLYVSSDIAADTSDEAIYSPAIAALIQSDDSLISAQKHSLALQDTLISSLRVGLNLRDTRIKLLESEVTPGRFRRLITATKYLALGAVVGAAIAHR